MKKKLPLYLKKLKPDFWWVLTFIIVILFVKFSILGFYLVPSASMEPNILPGDRILVNKLKYGLKLPFMKENLITWGSFKRGEIVVFEDDKSRKLIKRIIGLPGDSIVFRNGQIFVNNEALKLTPTGEKQPYVEDITVSRFIEENSKFFKQNHIIYMSDNLQTTQYENGRYFVDENSVFVLGDNRDFSEDSRTLGNIPMNRVFGEPFYILFSTDNNNQNMWPTFRPERKLSHLN